MPLAFVVGMTLLPGAARRAVGGRRQALATADLAQDPAHRVVVAVGYAFLERDDGVVRDVDVLRTDLGAALRDVAVADARRFAYQLRAVDGIQRVHLQLRQPHQEARPEEARLVLRVVPDHVADVLAEEALDALAELLAAVDIHLLDAVAALRLRRPLEGRYLLRHLEVERDVRDQVLDERERLDGSDADRLSGLEGVHASHAHEARVAVDLGAAGAALARLAVPADGEVVRLSGLDAVDDVEDNLALVHVDHVIDEGAAGGVAAEHAHREFGHYFPSSNSAFSSAGIWGSGSWETCGSPSEPWRMTTFTPPKSPLVFG